MQIRAATPDDLPDATDCMVAAFSADPLLGVFFDDSPLGRDPAAAQFFGLLLEVRLALNMPTLVARVDDSLVGVAMGYDTAPPDWPAGFQQRLQDFEAGHPALAPRFSAYDQIAATAKLDMPHYYLGVLAVRPDFQGRGMGKALLRAFVDLSDSDPLSGGTALETAAPANLDFYGGQGFEVRASGPLAQITLWSLFRPKTGVVPS
jgi:ribosomal protein S18 acetylase RimI-like enzyme